VFLASSIPGLSCPGGTGAGPSLTINHTPQRVLEDRTPRLTSQVMAIPDNSIPKATNRAHLVGTAARRAAEHQDLVDDNPAR